MTWSRLAPLLMLPVALNAWAQGDTTPGAGVVGVGVGATVMGILAALLRRQEMGVLLSAIVDMVRGQRGGGTDEVTTRMRRKLGIQLDPNEPAPGTGLLVDVARHEAEIIGMRAEMQGLRKAVEKLNELLTEVCVTRLAGGGDAKQ